MEGDLSDEEIRERVAETRDLELRRAGLEKKLRKIDYPEVPPTEEEERRERARAIAREFMPTEKEKPSPLPRVITEEPEVAAVVEKPAAVPERVALPAAEEFEKKITKEPPRRAEAEGVAAEVPLRVEEGPPEGPPEEKAAAVKLPPPSRPVRFSKVINWNPHRELMSPFTSALTFW